jgi:SPP1 family predicted phage head-tail adaptor
MLSRRAGQRRHLVSLQRTTRTTTATGFTDDWDTYATVWASVQPVAAAQVERLVSNTLTVPVSHLVTIDYLSDVTAKDRVLFGTRALFIQGWQNEDERGKTLYLACEERTA